MTIKHTIAAIDSGLERHHAAVALFNICKNADNNGQCTQSINDLAKRCKMSSRTAIWQLAKLESDGIIERILSTSDDGGSLPNTYRIKGFDSTDSSNSGGVAP